MASLRALPYTTMLPISVPSQTSEMPVLDLSCKKSSPPSPVTDSENESSISPLRGSPYPQMKQETNNNNTKNNNNNTINHINGYVHHERVQEKQIETTHEIQSHQHYHPQEETSTFSSSNHERKSPYENRAFVMTPPSETDSPKKLRYNQCYTHYPPVHPEEARVPLPMYAMPSFESPVTLPIVPTAVPPVLPQAPVVPPVPIENPPAASTHDISQTSTTTTTPTTTTTTPSVTCSQEDTKKAPRPFKAYPKDPLSITLGPDMIFDQDLKKAYTDFRSRMLDSVKKTNEGTNIKMRRTSKSPIMPTSTIDEKDAAYWERRRKNNEAAKRSRDARRAKEDEIAIRAAFLEQEYVRLKYENALLKEENTKMKCMIFSKF